MFKSLLKYLTWNKPNSPQAENSQSIYSDFDYENLCELYFENKWLRNQINHKGFEDLWFDFDKREEKLIIKKLINKFKYLSQEEAESIAEKKLSECIQKWNLLPENTLFIGFKKHKFADGSSALLQFLKPILSKIDYKWKETNFFTYLPDGKTRIRKGGFSSEGIILKKIVLVDDFIGSGGTAVKVVESMKNEIEEAQETMDLYVFSLAAMKLSKKVIKPTNVIFESCLFLDKGTDLAFPLHRRILVRKVISKMEGILFEGGSDFKLEDHNLGWKGSESLYSWNRFNIPNNNYPLLWWNRYKDGSSRKTMFNRMQ